MSQSCEISACFNIDLQPVTCFAVDPAPVTCLNVCLPGEGLELFSCDLKFIGYDQITSCTLAITDISFEPSSLVVVDANSAGVLYSLYDIDGVLVFDWQASNVFDLDGKAEGFYVAQVKDSFGCAALDVFEYTGPIPIELYTDFSEYVAGGLPSDWTNRFGTPHNWSVQDDATFTGGKKLSKINSTFIAGAITWDEADKAIYNGKLTDVRLEMRFMSLNNSTSGSNGSDVRAFIRGIDDGLGGSGYAHGNQSGGSGGTKHLARFDAGTDVKFATASRNTTIDQFMRLKAEVVGNTHKLKVWKESDGEPGAWDIEDTDATYPNQGLIGIAGEFRREYDVDWIRITEIL